MRCAAPSSGRAVRIGRVEATSTGVASGTLGPARSVSHSKLHKGRYFQSGSIFDQYGARDVDQRREVNPAIPVEAATWTAPTNSITGGAKTAAEWWGRVRGPDGHHIWIRASVLRRLSVPWKGPHWWPGSGSPLVAIKGPYSSADAPGPSAPPEPSIRLDLLRHGVILPDSETNGH